MKLLRNNAEIIGLISEIMPGPFQKLSFKLLQFLFDFMPKISLVSLCIYFELVTDLINTTSILPPIYTC